MNSGDRQPSSTLPVERDTPRDVVRQFELTVGAGPSSGKSWQSTGEKCSIGSHASNDLVIEDPTVSRFHCEVTLDPDGALVKDLGSLNGTSVDGVRVMEGFLKGGSILRLGKTGIRFAYGTNQNRLAVSNQSEFGSLVGGSVPMRAAFAMLEAAAACDSNVLLEGETGTGKEVAAYSIHQESDRRDKPFVVIDCSAIPANLLQSELFGHERGSFTGALQSRIGAFEEASGGTVFLDEIGEMPSDLQPKLLRVLEAREIRRVGGNQTIPVDVRIIAATNRDLRAEVNKTTFRPDLYFRLAVLKITLPPLRHRFEDLPMLVDRILEIVGASEEAAQNLKTPEFLASLSRSAWPGNVRELRNYVERCLVFEQPLPVSEAFAAQEEPAFGELQRLKYSDARRKALSMFERNYLEALLARNNGNVSAAAREAGVDRVHLHRLLRRNQIKRTG